MGLLCASLVQSLVFEEHAHVPLFVDEWSSYWAGEPRAGPPLVLIVRFSSIPPSTRYHHTIGHHAIDSFD